MRKKVLDTGYKLVGEPHFVFVAPSLGMFCLTWLRPLRFFYAAPTLALAFRKKLKVHKKNTFFF